MFDWFFNRSKEETSLMSKSRNDFDNFKSPIATMAADTAFEKTKVELVLTSEGLKYVLDGRLQSPLSEDDIEVIANYIRLNRDKKNKTKKEVIEETQDDLDNFTEEDLDNLN